MTSLIHSSAYISNTPTHFQPPSISCVKAYETHDVRSLLESYKCYYFRVLMFFQMIMFNNFNSQLRTCSLEKTIYFLSVLFCDDVIWMTIIDLLLILHRVISATHLQIRCKILGCKMLF